VELDASDGSGAAFPSAEDPSGVGFALQEGVPDAQFGRDELLEVALAAIVLDHLLDDAAFVSCPVGCVSLAIKLPRSIDSTFLQSRCTKAHKTQRLCEGTT
jgi:hypothetical protein